jgi:peptidoglycan/xylan/chitin deacetylase (PgdA/CDA1 family)
VAGIPHGPLTLAYHAVSTTWRARAAVPESDLRSQLAYLKKRGYVGFTITEAERRRREGTLPARSVVVTFDDGHASTLLAAPILEEFGYPGTVFVVTQFVESGEPLSWMGLERPPDGATDELRPLTWPQVEELVSGGWEVGSHTLTHPLLTRADDERLQDELVESRAAIERRLGRCSAIAYPYGQADRRVAAAASRAGYTVGCTLTFVHFVDEPLRRPRLEMRAAEGRIRLALKMSRLGRAARRSRPLRVARTMRRRRDWLPEG